jgi:two-component system, sensor histidine kinase and response regulator
VADLIAQLFDSTEKPDIPARSPRRRTPAGGSNSGDALRRRWRKSGLRGDAARCRELGIKPYLTKSIKRSELLQTVRLALGSPVVAEENRPVVTIHSLRESRGRLNPLLADDNRVNQAVATQFLEKRGQEVVVAGIGRAALKALEKQTPDLVLMDVQMPDTEAIVR